MKQKISHIFAGLIFVSHVAHGGSCDALYLGCEFKEFGGGNSVFFSIDRCDDKVQWVTHMSNSPTLDGVIRVKTDDFFVLSFPRSEYRHPTEIFVSRFDGAAEMAVYGEIPFFTEGGVLTGNPGETLFGSCEVIEKLF